MLLWVGAVLSGYLGYRLLDWWVPLAIAVGVVAVQAAMFRMVLGDQAVAYDLLAVSLVMNLVMFYATFGIGRAIGQRLEQRRRAKR
jgi:hypothetical protein